MRDGRALSTRQGRNEGLSHGMVPVWDEQLWLSAGLGACRGTHCGDCSGRGLGWSGMWAEERESTSTCV